MAVVRRLCVTGGLILVKTFVIMHLVMRFGLLQHSHIPMVMEQEVVTTEPGGEDSGHYDPHIYLSSHTRDADKISSANTRWHKKRKYEDMMRNTRWNIGKQWVAVEVLSMGYILESPARARAFNVVTAASWEFFQQVQATVASVQLHYPEKYVILYDWGLKPEQRHKVKSWCNVTLTPLNFSQYPVQSQMTTYSRPRYQAAKVLSIIDALYNHTSLLWLDPSLIFTSALPRQVYLTSAETPGFIFLKPLTYRQSFTLTKKEPSPWLPPPANEASSVLLMRTEHVIQNVWWWVYLCTLIEDCVVPTYSTMCQNRQPQTRTTDNLNQSTETTSNSRDEYQDCNTLSDSVLKVLGGNLYDLYVYASGKKYRLSLSQLSVSRKLAKSIVCSHA